MGEREEEEAEEEEDGGKGYVLVQKETENAIPVKTHPIRVHT
jgi:hypothetical protein